MIQFDFRELRMNWKIFLFCLLGVSMSNAKLQGEGIIEGDLAAENQFPYQVSILSEHTKISCGGGILDDYHILTAAHCVVGLDNQFKGKPLSVVAGTNDIAKRNTEGITVTVAKAYVPVGFDRKNTNKPDDIAVLKLSKSLGIAGNPKLKALQLATNTKETYSKQEAKIAGSGFDWINIVTDPKTNKLKEEGGIKDSRLKFIDVNVLDNADCQKLEKRRRKISQSQLCAQAKSRAGRKAAGVCSGDSGGPLVFGGNTVIGIVSTSPLGCRETRFPAIYSRVSAYVDFINKAKNDEVSTTIRTYNF